MVYDAFYFKTSPADITGIFEMLDRRLPNLQSRAQDGGDDLVFRTLLALPGESLQGITVALRHTGLVEVRVPHLASAGDIALAWNLLDSVHTLHPDIPVIMNGGREVSRILNEIVTELTDGRHENMMAILRHSQNETLDTVGIDLTVSPAFLRSQYPGLGDTELAIRTEHELVSAQWDYIEYFNYAVMHGLQTRTGDSRSGEQSVDDGEVGIPDLSGAAPDQDSPGEAGDSPLPEWLNINCVTNRPALANALDHVMIWNVWGREAKMVARDRFFEAVKSNQHITRLDPTYFVVDRMPDDVWQELYASFDEPEITVPATYLLRWNPSISSFTLDDYRIAYEENGDEWDMDWSIRQWKDARPGDHFFLLREGDGEGGIVMHGYFTSEPYEGDDWAGTDAKRMYVDLHCIEAAPEAVPAVSAETLEKHIPGVNWRNGHSGELMKSADGDMARLLWSLAMKEAADAGQPGEENPDGEYDDEDDDDDEL